MCEMEKLRYRNVLVCFVDVNIRIKSYRVKKKN